jgi:hypothetical protein
VSDEPPVRPGNLAVHGVADETQLIDRGHLRIGGHCLGQLLDHRQEIGPHHFLEQRFLGWEVEIDGAFRDAGAPRDLLHLRKREAVLQEHRPRGAQDLGRTRFLSPTPDGAAAIFVTLDQLPSCLSRATR